MGKMVEVDEEQLLRDQQLRETVGRIAKHPKASLMVQEALKLVDPNAATPGLDAMREIQAPIVELQKKFDDFVTETKKEKEDRLAAEKQARLAADWEAGRKALRADKWTDDGIKKLEEFMEQKGILDHDIARAAFEKMHPPPAPVTPGGSGSWNFMEAPAEGDVDLKKLIESRGENDTVLNKMVNDALAEVRGTARR